MTPEQRRRHGVYATPRPLVSFVVRSVHLLLQSRFGLRDGLADYGVRLLDPAAGAMNFVIEAWRVALDHVRRSDRERGIDDLISNHLLRHFQGIELLPKVCMEGRRAVREFFSQQGFPLDPGQRISLRRADALSSPRMDLSGGIPVLLGNPPWSGYKTHQGEWIRGLLHGYVRPDGSWEEGYFRIDGKRLDEHNVKWLQDDYVKFLRLAQWTIDHLGKGIVALVVNHNCLEAPTFRGLRQSLARTFNEIYALDLHGNRRKGERDENIFPGVSQGAGVLFLVKDRGSRRKVFLADLYGSRGEKLAFLESSDLASMDWTELPTSVPCVFRVRCGRERDEEEYRRGTPLPEIFPVHSLGVVTGQDAKAVAFDQGRGEPERSEPFLVRPFDRRFLASRQTVARPREAVMQHLRRPGNVALLALRQAGSLGAAAFVAPCAAGHKVLSGYFPNVVFPLYLYSPEDEMVSNLSAVYCHTLEDLLGWAPSPEEVLGHVYAVLYHPAYRARYRSQLWDGFPRIPFPESANLFRVQSDLGRKLVRLHLLELEDVAVPAPLRFEGDLSAALGRRCSFDGSRLRLNDRLLVEGVDPEVWGYQVGGYQVLECWLRARAGRTLTRSDREDFGRISEALRLTGELQREIGRYGD
jgi:predicted helicase